MHTVCILRDVPAVWVEFGHNQRLTCIAPLRPLTRGSGACA